MRHRLSHRRHIRGMSTGYKTMIAEKRHRSLPGTAISPRLLRFPSPEVSCGQGTGINAASEIIMRFRSRIVADFVLNCFQSVVPRLDAISLRFIPYQLVFPKVEFLI